MGKALLLQGGHRLVHLDGRFTPLCDLAPFLHFNDALRSSLSSELLFAT